MTEDKAKSSQFHPFEHIEEVGGFGVALQTHIFARGQPPACLAVVFVQHDEAESHLFEPVALVLGFDVLHVLEDGLQTLLLLLGPPFGVVQLSKFRQTHPPDMD